MLRIASLLFAVAVVGCGTTNNTYNQTVAPALDGGGDVAAATTDASSSSAESASATGAGGASVSASASLASSSGSGGSGGQGGEMPDAGPDATTCPSTCGQSTDGGTNPESWCLDGGGCTCNDWSSISDEQKQCDAKAGAFCDPHGGCRAMFCGDDPAYEPPNCMPTVDKTGTKIFCCY